MRSVLVCLALFFSHEAAAAPPQGRVAIAEVWSISFPKGEATRQVTQTVLRGVLVLPFDSWALAFELGIATPNTVFTAAPEVIAGATFKLSPNWSFGAFTLYHLNPPYGDAELTHVVGLSVAPAVKLSDWASFIFVVGAAKRLDDAGPWSLSFSPKFSFALPF